MIIGITGFATVGKDEVAKILVEDFDFIQLSFAASLKQAVYNLNPIVQGSQRVQHVVDQFGWDVAKKSFPEVRSLLQRMGTEVARELWSESFWTDVVDNQIYNQSKNVPTPNFVISDVRFINEAEFIKSNSGSIWHEGYVVRVNRPGVGPVNNHASDAGLPDNLIDFEIDNDGTLRELRFKVIELLRNL